MCVSCNCVSEYNEADGADQEWNDQRWETVLGFVDVVVASTHPAREDIGQRAGNGPRYHDTDEAADGEEAQGGGGEEVRRW